MRIDVLVTDSLTPAIRQFASRQLPQRRDAATESTLRDTLTDVVRLTPVETGRSRAAWVASLEELGGRPPAGWQGPQPTGEVEGRSAGQLTRQYTQDTSEAVAENRVAYVPFLEYGTSRMSPFAMVRASLVQARQRLMDRLQRLFR